MASDQKLQRESSRSRSQEEKAAESEQRYSGFVKAIEGSEVVIQLIAITVNSIVAIFEAAYSRSWIAAAVEFTRQFSGAVKVVESS